MTGVLCAMLGSNAFLDTQTVTVGIVNFGGPTFYGYSFGVGSISDGTFNPAGGATILNFYYTTAGSVIFTLSGVRANSGWTSVDIAGTTYTRTSATFTNSSNTIWTWTSATNPFGTTNGATKVCNFT